MVIDIKFYECFDEIIPYLADIIVNLKKSDI